MPKYFEDSIKLYGPKVPPVPDAMADLNIKTKKLNEFLDLKNVIDSYSSNVDFFKRLADIPFVQNEENNDIAADVSSEENNEIPDFTYEELMHEIDLLKKSSNCDSITEYKKKISNGEIINFSHAQIELWEMLEGKLQELEDGE